MLRLRDLMIALDVGHVFTTALMMASGLGPFRVDMTMGS